MIKSCLCVLYVLCGSIVSRFLVVQLGDIGDLVLSTPALDALREAHPSAHIGILTTPHAAPLVENTGLVDDVIVFNRRALSGLKSLINPRDLRRSVAFARQLRRGRYDTILYFHRFTTRGGALKFALIAAAAGSPTRIGLEHGNGFFLTDKLPDHGFGQPHQADAWLQVVAHVGASGAPRRAKIAVKMLPPSAAPIPVNSEGERAPVRIAIHAGSGGDSYARRWSPERFAQLADRLYEALNADIVLVGGASDDTPGVIAALRAPYTDLTGKTTLPELAGVLESCDLFIGADSGVMHVAAAAGVPVLAIFGPSNPSAWSPYTPDGRSVVVRSAPACSPCSYVGHELGERRGCPARTCMHMVTVDHVLQSARALLDTTKPPPLIPVEEKPGGEVQTVSILDLPVSVITYDRWIEQIEAWIDAPSARLHHVCTINPEMIMIARRDPIFKFILHRAALTVPDGVGLLWAARQCGHTLPERVTGSDGVPRIAQAAARHGWRIFLLGAAPGIAERAAAILIDRYPGLKIAGAYAGSPSPEQEDEIVARINATHADILFVAYGAPEQDKWIARNTPRLNIKMAMGVGGSLDFVAGVIPRAPDAMRQVGLEWLYRLYLQPWRFKRMLRLPRFVIAVLNQSRRIRDGRPGRSPLP